MSEINRIESFIDVRFQQIYGNIQKLNRQKGLLGVGLLGGQSNVYVYWSMTSFYLFYLSKRGGISTKSKILSIQLLNDP